MIDALINAIGTVIFWSFAVFVTLALVVAVVLLLLRRL
jgi:hypothetical protein